MAAGAIAVLATVFSGDVHAMSPIRPEELLDTPAIPDGENGISNLPATGFSDDWVFYVAGGAVLLLLVCILVPRLLPTKLPKDEDNEF